MNWAKNEIRKENRVLVVEGYFDAVRLLAAGIRCVVAPLGTALTADQAALLRRLTENVYLLYDSDKAGLTATFRAGDELLSHGMSVRVVTLPEGEDPDTFVRAKGAAALEAEIESAIDIFERKIQLLERGGWFAELQKKRRALDRLLPTLRATKDEIMRELYIGRASEVTGVSREVLERELKAKPPRGQSGERSITAPPQMAPRIRRGERRARHEEAGSSSERELVRAMLIKPALLESVAEKVDVESFRDPEYRAIYEALIQFGPDSTLEDLASVLEPDTIALMEDLASENMAKVEPGRNSEDSAGKTNQDTIAKTVQDSIAGLRAREIAERLAEIDRVFPLASAQEKDEMLAEKQELMKEMRGTGRQDYKAFRQRKWK
jgi:DNA primase